MRSWKKLLPVVVLVATTAALSSAPSRAISVGYQIYADDQATFYIDGEQVLHVGSSQWSAGTWVDLAPGWHDIRIDFGNWCGSNALGLRQRFEWEPDLQYVPLEGFRSQDETGEWIAGLRADYAGYDTAGQYRAFTVYGEGPINHGHTYHVDWDCRYEGVPGVRWGGHFGGWSYFDECLTGQILVQNTPVPEPAGLAWAGVGIVLAGGAWLRSRRRG